METYARELIPRLAAIDGLQLTAFVNRETAGAGEGPWFDIPNETVPVKARNRVDWVRGEQQHLPRMARAGGMRAGAQPGLDLAAPRAVSTRDHDPRPQLQARARGPLRLAAAGHGGVGPRLGPPLAPDRGRCQSDGRLSSSATYAYRAAKIDVVPLGVTQERLPAAVPERHLRDQLALGERPILLSVSAKRPHKNLLRLIEAHAQLDPATRPVLVIPGYPTPHEAGVGEPGSELGTEDQVRLPAWLSPADLEGLYAASQAFAFPSLHEGFGLPVLEAMRRGVPVACSDRSTLPEVAGEAALLFDPEEVGAIKAALERLLYDVRLRERLHDAGPARAALFSWDATAEATAAVYRRALSSP